MPDACNNSWSDKCVFLLSIAVMFIHDLPLHTFHTRYDVIYICILINDTSKDLSLYKVYLLCSLNMEDNWYALLILWKNHSWVISSTLGSSSLFFFKKGWKKILGSLLTIVCSISSDYTICQCTAQYCISQYWILEWACMLTKYV